MTFSCTLERSIKLKKGCGDARSELEKGFEKCQKGPKNSNVRFTDVGAFQVVSMSIFWLALDSLSLIPLELAEGPIFLVGHLQAAQANPQQQRPRGF